MFDHELVTALQSLAIGGGEYQETYWDKDSMPSSRRQSMNGRPSNRPSKLGMTDFSMYGVRHSANQSHLGSDRAASGRASSICLRRTGSDDQLPQDRGMLHRSDSSLEKLASMAASVLRSGKEQARFELA